MDKQTVITILEEIALFLELNNENPFKIRAYANGARVLQSQPDDLETLVQPKKLESLKGIGKGLSENIRELVRTGKLEYYEELKKTVPKGLLELMTIPGLGPRKAKALYEKLDVHSIGELEYACHENRLLKLEGFGQKSQDKILKGIEYLKKSSGKFLISEAENEACKTVEYLKKQKGVLKIEIAGSIRRRKEVIQDIDILVAAKDPGKIHKAFVENPDVENVTNHGETKSSVILKSGIQCDLRTVDENEFPYALYYFTGSKEHNVEVRTAAKKKGYKINEYGLFKGTRLVKCSDETAILNKLGYDFIAPELREAQGELEKAARKELPDLIDEKSVRGVFHVHSTYSDGLGSLEDMIARAQELKFDYIGISDHSQSARYAHGLDAVRLKEQKKEIDLLQKKYKNIRIFWGIESDILADGALDYSENILKNFDFVIGSIHSQFNLKEKEQTARILRAMESKYLTFIGHITGRLLLAREGYSLEMTRILDYAAQTKTAIEINANPRRLDLDWRYLAYAKERGVKVGIHPDAHSLNGLSDVRYGVGIARKGGLESGDVVNTWPVAKVEKFLLQRRK